jgi:CheY-like chemotaxis protein
VAGRDLEVQMGQTYTSILAVDDDPILLQVLTAFFAKYDITNVVTANNGIEATKLVVERDDIDLIVSDLHMPGADGIEFLDYLKGIGCRVPLVIVSSADKSAVMAAGVLATAYQLNFVGSLSKPIDFNKLASLLGLL